MTNNPLVTISIPTCNSEKFIGLCLKNIKNQTYDNIEINIIDGDSKDKTVEIAKKFGVSDIMIYKDALLGARYEGVKMARGEYIFLLDSDQILEADTIAKAVKMMKQYDMLVLEEDVYKKNKFIEKLFYYDRKLVHTVKDFNPNTSVMLPRFYKKNLLLNAFSYIPENILKTVGGQDHAIIYYEVWQLSKKIDLLPKAVKHIEPNSLSAIWKKFYRWGRTSVGARYGRYNKFLTAKERFRKGLFQKGLIKESLASILLLLIKGVPYKIGYFIGIIKKYV